MDAYPRDVSVLRTKLHLPSSRRRLVARGRLTDLLRGDHAAGARLVLVAAPAGFGKTTLLAEWLRAKDRPFSVAWLALDSGDSNVEVFLTDLVAAIQTVEPSAGVDALALLSGGGTTWCEAVLVSLINDLDVLLGPTVVALDDYHVIGDAGVHEAMTYLLDNLPAQVTLAMTTRADPPLPLSRLRARGELVEVRAADLRFTPDEAGEFLNGVMDLHLEPALVAALETRTEGWVAGLQLAALSARTHRGAEGSGDVAGFVEAFSGSHRFVLDYLVEEVVDRQPDEVRDFMLDTSVLEALTGELCDALTGRPDGQAMLEQLERDNLFVVPLDDERRWFRYHHLFAVALRARLTARSPERVGVLHAAASRWLAEHELLRDAVMHAQASGDHERTADLVELSVADMRRRRQDRVLRDWLTALPDDVIKRRPLLAALTGWSRLSEGDFDGVEAWLDAAEAGLDSTTKNWSMTEPLTQAARAREREISGLPALIAAYRACVAQARGDIEGTISFGARALELAGPGDHFARAAGAGFVGLAAWAAGDLVNAVDTFSKAVESLHEAGLIADELGASVVLANMWLARGQPSEGQRLYERSLQTAERFPGPMLSTVGDLHVGLADLLREQGDLVGASQHLEVARDLGDRASLPENRFRWYTASAALSQARGVFETAVELLAEAEALYLPGYFPDVRPIPASRARVRIAQGVLDDAREWARERGVTPSSSPTYLGEYDQLTLARLLLAEGNAREALELISRVAATAGTAGRYGSLVESTMLQALAHHASGDEKAATAELAVALTAGVPAGYRRLFLDEGPPMLDLLEVIASDAANAAQSHAEQLVALSRRPKAPTPTRTASVDRLSEREFAVMRLLASELSGPEIARELYVSVNTLRTHTKHIFNKLDVNTRRAAVRRATEIGLL